MGDVRFHEKEEEALLCFFRRRDDTGLMLYLTSISKCMRPGQCHPSVDEPSCSSMYHYFFLFPDNGLSIISNMYEEVSYLCV